MKKFENSFVITGYVGKDAEIRSFEKSSVARFCIILRHSDKEAREQVAFLFAETWVRNDDTTTADLLKKGSLITMEGFFKPEEWTDTTTGIKHSRITLVATKVYATPEVAESTATPSADK